MKKSNKKLVIVFLAVLLAGCAPVKILDVVEIKPNETAWAIPLDGSSQAGQVKFNSVAFLNEKKIAAKRIMVDKVERSVGRFPWEIEWIPATRVITVDRSLVTREWTDSPETGTSSVSQGIGVVTKDSVKLKVGLTITANIEEDDASTYLYYHGEKSLKDVIDQNVRSFAVSELTKEYSQLTLSDAQTKGTEIYDKLFNDAKATFKEKGITVQFLGNSEGLNYADKTVQDSINRSYLAQQDNKTAQMEQNAQKIRNETLVLNAQAQADAAQKLFAAQEAAKFNNNLQISLLEAQARMKMADKWSGNLPTNILPANSPLLLNLGATEKNP